MFVHGDNLSQKEEKGKYTDSLSKEYLAEIRENYDEWHRLNMSLKGPYRTPNIEEDRRIINTRVRLFNDYKDFLDQKKYAEHFDSRSNLHSSTLEEFIYYLFKDLVEDFSKEALIGKSHAFKDIFFRSKNYADMIRNPCIQLERKDHDFVIGSRISANFKCDAGSNIETVSFDIPAVAIECKTYLDKTMLEGSSTAGEQLKDRNPNALYFVVAERLKLTESVNLKKYKVDQIYVLRKEKNVDREYRLLPGYRSNPIFDDVVWHLFDSVRSFLTTDWHGTISDGIDRGYLIK